MTIEMLKKLTTISNLNAQLGYGRRTELQCWPDRQRRTYWILTCLMIFSTIPMMMLSHYTKEASIRFPWQTQFFFSSLNAFFIIFCFFYLHFSSSLSISVTHLLHVITILRRNRKRQGSMSTCLPSTHLGLPGFLPHHNHHPNMYSYIQYYMATLYTTYILVVILLSACGGHHNTSPCHGVVVVIRILVVRPQHIMIVPPSVILGVVSVVEISSHGWWSTTNIAAWTMVHRSDWGGGGGTREWWLLAGWVWLRILLNKVVLGGRVLWLIIRNAQVAL